MKTKNRYGKRFLHEICRRYLPLWINRYQRFTEIIAVGVMMCRRLDCRVTHGCFSLCMFALKTRVKDFCVAEPLLKIGMGCLSHHLNQTFAFTSFSIRLSCFRKKLQKAWQDASVHSSTTANFKYFFSLSYFFIPLISVMQLHIFFIGDKDE